MEQVNKSSGDYCKHCFTPIMHSQFVDTAIKDQQAATFQQGLQYHDIECMLRHYIQSSGITEQSQRQDLIQRIMLPIKSSQVADSEHDLFRQAIHMAQELLVDHYKKNATNYATPVEKPGDMKTQALSIWPGNSKRYLPSLLSLLRSIHASITGRR